MDIFHPCLTVIVVSISIVFNCNCWFCIGHLEVHLRGVSIILCRNKTQIDSWANEPPGLTITHKE